MKKKRFWGILLSLVMLLGLMPETSMTAQAEDAEPQLTYQVSLYKNDKGWKVYRTHQTTTSFTINGGDFMIAVGHTSGYWWIYRNKGSNTGIMSLTGSADSWNQRNNVKVSLNGIGTGSASIQEAYAPNGNKNKRVIASTRTIQAKIERECAASATDYTCEYDQNPHTIGGVNVVFPQSGAVIKYGTVNNAYTLTEAPTFTNAGTYTVYYQVSGTADDLGAWVPVTGSATVTINKAPAPTVTVPTLDAVTYDPEKTLADIDLPEGWAWTDETAVPTVDNTGYNAALTVDDANYDYTGVEGYDADTHRVIRTVELTVNNPQIDPAYTITIPTAVNLKSSAPVSIEAEGVELNEGQKIVVTLDGATYTESGSKFSAKDKSGESVVSYSIKAGDKDVSVGSTVAEFVSSTDPQSVPLKFTADASKAKYAGAHTETLTFGVKLEDPNAPKIYNKNSENIADGVVLENVGDTIDTTDTLKGLRFNSSAKMDFKKDGTDGTMVFNFQPNAQINDVESMYLDDNRDFICVTSTGKGKLIPDEGKQFRVKYNLEDNRWIIDQV